MAKLTSETFENALMQLEEAVELAEKHRLLNENNYFTQFRTASIQAFEYCYDMGQKLMRKHIEQAGVSDREFRHLKFRDYMRVAGEYGLLQDPEEWVNFREWRNDTSHTYDGEIAQALFEILPSVIISMRYTCARLKDQLDVCDE